MFPASTKGGGQCVTPGPTDVCKTPSPAGPVPIPYPNIAMLTNASGSTVSTKVKILNKEVATQKTEISMSTGDEAGSAGGGVISNKIKGEAKYKTGSSKVKAEGQKIVYVTCMVGQNGSNANMPASLQVAPSQTKVMVGP
jgi:hypothetical protein